MPLGLSGDGEITGFDPTASGFGKVLQVVSAFKNDAFSSSSTTTGADIPGLSALITPKSTSSKILLTVSITSGNSGAALNYFRIFRDATEISAPATGSLYFGAMLFSVQNVNDSTQMHHTFLDSPNTTSATTYKIRGYSSGGTFYVNRRGDDANYTGTSSLTLMEVAA